MAPGAGRPPDRPLPPASGKGRGLRAQLPENPSGPHPLCPFRTCLYNKALYTEPARVGKCGSEQRINRIQGGAPATSELRWWVRSPGVGLDLGSASEAPPVLRDEAYPVSRWAAREPAPRGGVRMCCWETGRRG